MRHFQFLALGLIALSISACAGKQSPTVVSMQKKDKFLSCKEILLEINEAEFYRRTAQNNKNPGVSNILMPLGYISTYVNAEEAIKAANARADYLNRVYEILDCEDPGSASHAAMASHTQERPAAPMHAAAPAPSYQQAPHYAAPQQQQPYYYAPQAQQYIGSQQPNFYHPMEHQGDEMMASSTYW